ncbi:urease accessory protein UreE [Myroides phaeus]|uniref:urease accessory protein UreE n=1 Tax=Myroides phaeus TaxID=702745 RepID=UPI00130343D4|nr:urease accessory protein UreE [Myroides phaeus]
MQEVILIDEVLSAEVGCSNEVADVFEIEWFETQKQLIKRQTKQGVELHLTKTVNRDWQQGDLLCANGVCLAKIAVKPALCIVFSSDVEREVADFCYYIGNRHLPLFTDADKKSFTVPYDGNLYEQLLAKLNDKISLQEKTLLMQNEVKHVRKLIKLSNEK